MVDLLTPLYELEEIAFKNLEDEQHKAIMLHKDYLDGKYNNRENEIEAFGLDLMAKVARMCEVINNVGVTRALIRNAKNQMKKFGSDRFATLVQ